SNRTVTRSPRSCGPSSASIWERNNGHCPLDARTVSQEHFRRSSMTQKNSLTWFITGCSSGFGRELTKVVLDRGYRAAVTARDPKQVADLVSGHEDRTLALRLDVTDPAQVAESVRRAEEHFGRIDVLVNNAGIGYFAAVEESDEAELRR